MSSLAALLKLLSDHAPLVELLVDVLERGARRDRVEAALRAALIQASDDTMRAQLSNHDD